jgi:hypothetical protein
MVARVNVEAQLDHPGTLPAGLQRY